MTLSETHTGDHSRASGWKWPERVFGYEGVGTRMYALDGLPMPTDEELNAVVREWKIIVKWPLVVDATAEELLKRGLLFGQVVAGKPVTNQISCTTSERTDRQVRKVETLVHHGEDGTGVRGLPRRILRRNHTVAGRGKIKAFTHYRENPSHARAVATAVSLFHNAIMLDADRLKHETLENVTDENDDFIDASHPGLWTKPAQINPYMALHGHGTITLTEPTGAAGFESAINLDYDHALARRSVSELIAELKAQRDDQTSGASDTPETLDADIAQLEAYLAELISQSP